MPRVGVSVVNVEVNGAMTVPAGLEAFTVTVYVVLVAKPAVGVNVADEVVVASVPGTMVPPELSATDTDAGFSDPENVTVTGLVTATPEAPDAGVTDATEGAGSAPPGSPLLKRPRFLAALMRVAALG
jgi:hypothetical protein